MRISSGPARGSVAELRRRVLDWDGCVNVRDLGGHPTEDGAKTRFGGIVRADSVRQLSDEGWAAAVEYGIRTVVDLRFHSELEADPPAELPVDVVHVSLLGDEDPQHWRHIDAISEAAENEVASKRAVYLEWLELFQPEFRRALAAVAEAPDGGILVHCLAGKDRTGLVVALLLRLAGVGYDEIGRDFTASEQNLRAATERWIAEAPDEQERARRRRSGSAPKEAMVEVLIELERRYGSVRGYLIAAGVTPEQLDLVAVRLRG